MDDVGYYGTDGGGLNVLGFDIIFTDLMMPPGPDGLATLEARSVRKKLKQPSFARGVNRDEVVEGAEELGVDLDEHIAFVIAALRPISAELGLRS